MPLVLGTPISAAQIKMLSNNNDGGQNKKERVIRYLIKALSDLTIFKVAVSSHDLSRNGESRMDSTGHNKGYSTDLVLLIQSGDKIFPIIDLINSMAFIEYLRQAAIQFINYVGKEGLMKKSRNVLIGVEYDHLHIEWPWSDRYIPIDNAPITFRELVPFVTIGTFYNPQQAYGLPRVRSGHEFGTLQSLMSSQS
jgi:hypothetical protein